MSYQPLPPAGGQPPGPMPTFSVPPPPEPPPPEPIRRHRGQIGFGVILLIGGLVAGGVLFALSATAKNETLKKFARAPVGCTTTLQFEKKAVFTIYVETKGASLDVGGDCAGNGNSYDRGDAAAPTVRLSLVDGQDASVPMTPSSKYSYTTPDFRGASVEQVDIQAPGVYRLTVESKDDNFAIAIGGDPAVDSRRMRLIGAGCAAAGLLVGMTLLLLGLRRRATPDAEVEWSPTAVASSPSFSVPPNAPVISSVPISPTSMPPPPPPPSPHGFQPPPPPNMPSNVPPSSGGWGAPG